MKRDSTASTVRIWLDGELQAPGQARVSVLDRGFLYGDSVFETLRTYAGRPFALKQHMERLFESARKVLIVPPLSLEKFTAEVEEAATESEFPESYLRVMITRGEGALGLDPQDCDSPLRVILVGALRSPEPADYLKGIKAVTFVTTRVQDDTPAAGAKVGNYLVAVLAQRKAREAGAGEALIQNARGEISEGATSNVFWLAGGVLKTPPLEAGILDGITRRHILAVAEKLSVPVVFEVPTLEVLLGAEGVFVSSSIRELMSVTRIDDVPVAGAVVQESVLRLHREFRSQAGAEPLPDFTGN